MPTDLQRIELAFPAEAMLHVVDHGADATHPEVLRVRRLLVGFVDDASSARTSAGLGGHFSRISRSGRCPRVEVRVRTVEMSGAGK